MPIIITLITLLFIIALFYFILMFAVSYYKRFNIDYDIKLKKNNIKETTKFTEDIEKFQIKNKDKIDNIETNKDKIDNFIEM